MPDNEKTVIKISPAGPYKVTGIDFIKVSTTNEIIETPRGKALLCGCGQSSKMPHCDGAHAKAGFKSEKKDDRVPTHDKDYYGEEITVHFDLAACAHVAYCIRQLPEVFDTKKRPWVNPDKGNTEDIIKIVRSCPAGALSYTLKDQERVDSFDSDVSIIYHRNGPFEVWGDVELQGCEAPKVGDHYTLCSCGKSKNHPYCDGEHHKK